MGLYQLRITHMHTSFLFFFPRFFQLPKLSCNSAQAQRLTLRNAPKNLKWSGGTRWGRGRSQTSPFNFLKTFQHLFCTLTYANSKGPQWLGSHFRPSVEPESSSAVKWERRSAVWKWISLAEIRGALSEPCTPSMGKKNCCTNCFWYIKYLLLYFTDGKQ